MICSITSNGLERIRVPPVQKASQTASTSLLMSPVTTCAGLVAVAATTRTRPISCALGLKHFLKNCPRRPVEQSGRFATSAQIQVLSD